VQEELQFMLGKHLLNICSSSLTGFHAALSFFLGLLLALPGNAQSSKVSLKGNTHSSRDIVEFLRRHPTATLNHLTITDRLVLPYGMPIKELTVNDVIFKQGLQMAGPMGTIKFYNSMFGSDSSFYLSKFDDFECNRCTFESNVTFHSVTANSLWLNGSHFRGNVFFVAVKIKTSLNLADTIFDKAVDFSGAVIEDLNPIRLTSSQPIMIRWSQFGAEWVHKFYAWALAVSGADRISRLRQLETALQWWQNNFAQLGYKSDQLEANCELIQLRRNYFTEKFSWDWLTSVVLELPSRYGTRPYRPLKVGATVILCFGLIFWFMDPFEQKNPADPRLLPRRPRILFSVLFSIDTFLPFVNVTGVKEWGWAMKPRFRWVELTERILGVAVSALAAYNISQVL
jgi:hypothetical protein